MTLYIILIFVALCAGMAISVHAFGTGGKRKRIFQDIYFSVEDTEGVGVLYTKTGEYSAMLKIENPVQKVFGEHRQLLRFHASVLRPCPDLGRRLCHSQAGHLREEAFLSNEDTGKQEFLSESYFRYFKGRAYTDSMCYLTITQEARKSRLFLVRQQEMA